MYINNLLRIFSLFFLLFLNKNLFSQYSNISGYILDMKTRESIQGAIVIIEDMPHIGIVSNSYGYFSLKVPNGEHTILVKNISFDNYKSKLNVSTDIKLDILLSSKASKLKDVKIKSKRKQDLVKDIQVSKIQIDLSEIEKLPVILGEKDIMKSIQLLPGIKAAQEGQSGIVVRGGNTDQNLILLDEATVYNSSHMMGFFSTFNSDAIKDMVLFKGNTPAEYGGRLSSVIDIKMKEGNLNNYNLSGGVGLISSRLLFQGPLIKKTKGSFMLAGRRTYVDLFLPLLSDTNAKNSTLYFYDFNAKANYKFDQNNRLFFSGYFGKDNFGFNKLFDINYGNTTFTSRFNHVFSDKLFSNTSLIYNNYNYTVSLHFNEFDLYIKSIISDYSFKQDFDYYLNEKNKLKFGLLSTWHNVVPGDITSQNTTLNNKSLTKSNGWEKAFYLQNEQKISNSLSLNYGLRVSCFSVIGNNILYDYKDSSTDTITFKGLNLYKNYFNLEPRFSLNYSINENNSLKFALSRNVQNLHLLSNSVVSRPTDRWMLTNNNVKPEINDQFSIGYFMNFGKNNDYEFSIESYYKNLSNQIDYKTGTELRANDNVDKSLVYGEGRAYGLELFLKKKFGLLTGWISYSLSRSERNFEEIDNNKSFPFRYDRTHDIAIVLMYKLSEKIDLSSNFIFYTGNAVTYPTGKTYNQSFYSNIVSTNSVYNGRNLDRMPNYNRLDLAVNWLLKKNEKFEHSLNFSLYNAFGIKNPFTIDFKSDINGNYIQKTYLFSFVPSITYNFNLLFTKKQ